MPAHRGRPAGRARRHSGPWWLAAAACLLPPGTTAAPAPQDALTPDTAVRLAGWTVVLDPGHGGEDPGVTDGPLPEAELALTQSRQVAETLVRLGARVVLTRDEDTLTPPDARAARANQAGATVFVSLHFNRAPRATAVGAEVYTHLPGPPDDAGPALSGGTFTGWAHVQDAHLTRSEALADQLVTALGEAVPLAPTPRVRMPLRVLAGVDAPAVLVELAYLSNPEQAAAAATPEFQSAVAGALAAGLSRLRDPGDSR